MPVTFLVDMPGAEQRADILKVLLRSERLEPGFNFATIAKHTDGYSGSDLRQVCKTAAIFSVQELLGAEAEAEAVGSDDDEEVAKERRPLSVTDFLRALETVRPSVTTAQAYRFRQEALKTR